MAVGDYYCLEVRYVVVEGKYYSPHAAPPVPKGKSFRLDCTRWWLRPEDRVCAKLNSGKICASIDDYETCGYYTAYQHFELGVTPPPQLYDFRKHTVRVWLPDDPKASMSFQIQLGIPPKPDITDAMLTYVGTTIKPDETIEIPPKEGFAVRLMVIKRGDTGKCRLRAFNATRNEYFPPVLEVELPSGQLQNIGWGTGMLFMPSEDTTLELHVEGWNGTEWVVTDKVTFYLKALKSKLIITTTPSRASVYINGEYKGVT